MNIYVGNLSFQTNEQDLGDHFDQFGEVSSARIITDRDTGRSRGFGFVEMTSDTAGQEAIERLNGQAFMERSLTVNEARPREERSNRY